MKTGTLLKSLAAGGALVALATVAVRAGFSTSAADAAAPTTVAAAAPTAVAANTESASATADSTEITVYKTPTCHCCAKWVDHLRANGFKVTTQDMADVSEVKANLGVSSELQSCHTGVVDGYVVEGHVPAADIRRLLRERPKVAGIAVPGMPMGSPGMEGARTDKYDVVTFDRAGKTAVFASH